MLNTPRQPNVQTPPVARDATFDHFWDGKHACLPWLNMHQECPGHFKRSSRDLQALRTFGQPNCDCIACCWGSMSCCNLNVALASDHIGESLALWIISVMCSNLYFLGSDANQTVFHTNRFRHKPLRRRVCVISTALIHTQPAPYRQLQRANLTKGHKGNKASIAGSALKSALPKQVTSQTWDSSKPRGKHCWEAWTVQTSTTACPRTTGWSLHMPLISINFWKRWNTALAKTMPRATNCARWLFLRNPYSISRTYKSCRLLRHIYK